MTAHVPTQRQVSAGGVVYRRNSKGRGVEVVLIAVGTAAGGRRWQLPKGIVEKGESPEDAALREAREEGGVEAALIAPIETVEYWYYSGALPARIRYHKVVHFFLLQYQSGDVRDHDDEVEEARWVPVNEATEMLAFKNERRVLEQAARLLTME